MTRAGRLAIAVALWFCWRLHGALRGAGDACHRWANHLALKTIVRLLGCGHLPLAPVTGTPLPPPDPSVSRTIPAPNELDSLLSPNPVPAPGAETQAPTGHGGDILH